MKTITRATLLGISATAVAATLAVTAACGGGAGGGAGPGAAPGAAPVTPPAPAAGDGATWFVTAPKQAGNHWDGGAAGDLESVGYPVAELEQIDAFLETRGIEAVALGYAWSVEPVAVCEALSCPRGDELLVLADAAAASKLAELGFARVAAGGLWSLAGKQCESAWGEPGEPEVEATTLANWLGAQGAAPVKIGFVWSSTKMMYATVCGGPRGMSAVAAGDAAVLTRLGFAPSP